MTALPTQLPQAHQVFLELVAEVRPELHRYCTRMTGSVVDGEDVVQDTLAKAFYTLGMSIEVPTLRPWLFRVAHNTAIDFMRRYEKKHVDLVPQVPEAAANDDDGVDRETVRAALSTFLVLPPLQRSSVILKDVLGHSNAEIAEALGTTVLAVKAALVRGRTRLRDEATQAHEDEKSLRTNPDERVRLDRYVSLFNAGDWDGVRALLSDEVRLDLVSKAARQGKAVGQYFGRYAAENDVRVSVGELEGQSVLWVFVPKDAARPKYFIHLDWDGDRVRCIRDFRYVDYIARELELVPHVF